MSPCEKENASSEASLRKESRDTSQGIATATGRKADKEATLRHLREESDKEIEEREAAKKADLGLAEYYKRKKQDERRKAREARDEQRLRNLGDPEVEGVVDRVAFATPYL